VPGLNLARERLRNLNSNFRPFGFFGSTIWLYNSKVPSTLWFTYRKLDGGNSSHYGPIPNFETS